MSCTVERITDRHSGGVRKIGMRIKQDRTKIDYDCVTNTIKINHPSDIS